MYIYSYQVKVKLYEQIKLCQQTHESIQDYFI
jgi:hypothetical protein